jgi:hypothetical protein
MTPSGTEARVFIAVLDVWAKQAEDELVLAFEAAKFRSAFFAR